MAVSVTDPIERAYHRMVRILFQPFRLEKWFVVGFGAWLSTLGQGGCQLSMRAGSDDPSKGGGQQAGEVMERVGSFLSDHPALVAAAVLGGLSIWGVVLWVSSRGTFMFLDNVVFNRAAVVDPWKKNKARGNSLFRFYLLFHFAGLVSLVAVVATALGLAWEDIQRETFGSGAVTALAVGLPLLVLLIVGFLLISLLLIDFVTPLMFRFDVTATEGWRLFGAHLLRDHSGSVVLYVLLRALLWTAAGFLSVVAMCLTCCLAMIPYIGTVILLPIFVFLRCYPLYFIEQHGEDFRIFPETDSG